MHPDQPQAGQETESYYIYDSRYRSEPEESLVIEICDTLEDAREKVKGQNSSDVIVLIKQKYLGDDVYETLSATVIE